MVNFTSKIILFCFTLSISTGCYQQQNITPDEPEDETPVMPTNYANGFFVVNQGNENSGDPNKYASISFIDTEKSTVAPNLYKLGNNNGSPQLSSTFLSMSTHKGLAYIVSPNNNKIDVVRLSDFKYVGGIYGLKRPRYFQVIDENTAWVTQWGTDGISGSIAVLDLTTNSIVNEIPTNKGPEQMFRVEDMMYISNTGGFHMDSVVTKIDIVTETVVKEINVGKRPQSFQLDKNNALWVLSRGEKNFSLPELSIPGQLSKIVNDNVVQILALSPGAGNLSINSTKDEFYFTMNDGVYKHDINQSSVNLAPYIGIPYVNIFVESETDNIIGANPGNFVSNGQVVIHSPSGEVINKFDVGIIPIDFFIMN